MGGLESGKVMPLTHNFDWDENGIFDLKVVDMAFGQNHALVLTESGDVFTAGNNKFGQAGLGHTRPVLCFQKLRTLSNVRTIAAGQYHSIAITVDGDVYTWGLGQDGQLGLGQNQLFMPRPKYNPHCRKFRVESVSCGAKFTAFVSADHELYVCGHELFHGRQGSRPLFTPHRVLCPVAFTPCMSAGASHLCILDADGSVHQFDTHKRELSRGEKRHDADTKHCGENEIAVSPVVVTHAA